MKNPRVFLSAEGIRFQEQSREQVKTYSRSELDPSLWGELVVIRPKEEYQEIHGFGASFTDTAAIVMSEMPKKELEQAMTKLFDKKEGIGLSLIRNCLGGSDFTPKYYTYDDMPEGEEVGQFDCGGCNHGVYRMEDGYKMFVSNPEGQLCCTFIAQKQFRQCKATMFGTPEQGSFGLNNAIMIMFAFAGAMQGILLMHASVPMLNDKAYLCLGKSGTGKSTHCKLWLKHVEGTDLLNDDNPAVRYLDGKAYIYGTPWSGKTPCYRNLRKECGAFLRLQQYPGNIIKKHNPLQGFASILSSCSTMIWDKPSYNAICDTVSKIASITASYHLRCKPDKDAARLSYNTIAR